MPEKKIIDELKKLLKKKAKVTKAQREYAMIEEAMMLKLCPIQKPYEKVSSSNLRTLDKYLRKY
jgi:hypothetical protein